MTSTEKIMVARKCAVSRPFCDAMFVWKLSHTPLINHGYLIYLYFWKTFTRSCRNLVPLNSIPGSNRCLIFFFSEVSDTGAICSIVESDIIAFVIIFPTKAKSTNNDDER